MPVLISGLVAFVLATFLWAAYLRVEATLIRAAGERAQGAAEQIASLLDGRRSTDQLRQLSTDPVLQRFIKIPTEDDAREAARARLAPLLGTGPRRVEVWDNAGSRLLEIVTTGGDSGADALETLPPGAAPSNAGRSPLQGSEGSVFTDLVAEIHDSQSIAPLSSSSGPLGYVRIRSTFVETPPGIFSRLVGRDASVRIGNRTEGTWTDLARLWPSASIDLTRPGITQYQTPSGERRLAAIALIEATPWAAWVEFPMAPIVAPARGFLNGMMVIALVFIAAAAVLATALAARITTPLSEMNMAAAAVASGDYSRRVTIRRRDELGQLGSTYNAMAADIEAASQALKKSEDSYRRLFASNPHPMWVYDVETLRFLDVNNMATVHYGYSRDEFLAMTIKDIRPPTELAALLENVSRMTPAVEISGTWKHQKKDGTIIDVEVSSHELLVDGRRARAVVAHDMTERLRAQEALRESEALFRGMAETMPHIVWTARPDGEFEYFNRKWFEYTGLSLEDTQRSNWELVLHPDDREDTTARRTHAFQTGSSYEIAFRLKGARDGEYRWHIGRAAPLRNDAGTIVMWVGTSTDVDDVRRASDTLKTLNAELEERVRARTADLEAANHELESFSYSVSHDLRAPLRHVQGYVEMLTASTDGQLSGKSQRYLKTIADATTEMGDLIDDLLAFSRISRIQMSEDRVSLDAVVRNSIDGLEMATRDRNIVWKIVGLPDVVGDPSLLKQVYANLLGNAVKYSRQRDLAEIKVGCAGEEDGRLVLFVHDNGAGFDMKYVHKLFGVFQRLHRADEFEGTGIGLATVRRIITRHGGRTWAEGGLGEGATIFFTLQPAAPSPHSDEPAIGPRDT